MWRMWHKPISGRFKVVYDDERIAEIRRLMKDRYWPGGDAFWSPSYFLATTGNVTIDIIKQYVENQRALQR